MFKAHIVVATPEKLSVASSVNFRNIENKDGEIAGTGCLEPLILTIVLKFYRDWTTIRIYEEQLDEVTNTVSNYSKKTSAIVLFATALLLASFSATSTEACTYEEGALAFKQNNMIRAEMLLNMAQRDGDKRAELFLATHFELRQQPVQVALK